MAADPIAQYRPMLRDMALGAFSGSVDHDTRARLERIGQDIDWRLQVCWTCGGSLQQMARLILNKYPDQ